MAEHFIHIEGVEGSNPSATTFLIRFFLTKNVKILTTIIVAIVSLCSRSLDNTSYKDYNHGQ